ncbi:ATP12 family chaperone protein [Maritalea porphyrae]|jgi:chaperone required for assembly of F1-ATPase|uniref:ATP12 family chaperone protein n=1 Tax=Maritalea porphyrae TaxID=880732 RepID=UPI0022AFDEC7|nr:ATP12 family protein [Maritalea porphyrae]MCZ4272881.1 ATPase [Maritalea porphyrae]
MREILEDAEAHIEDGYGRAQKHQKQQLAKRFYKQVSVGAVEGGFGVLLDGRSIKSPGKTLVKVPSQRLATLLAAEWDAQEKEIDPATMPLTRLVNTTVEKGEETLDAVKAEIVKFAGNDLLTYRADTPQELVDLQSKHWGGALDAFTRRYDVSFNVITGVIHQDQPPEVQARVGEIIAPYGVFGAFCTMLITSITGSAILSVGLAEGLFSASEVLKIAYVDEDYQASHWGEDAEAMRMRAFKRQDFDAAVKVLELVEREL